MSGDGVLLLKTDPLFPVLLFCTMGKDGKPANGTLVVGPKGLNIYAGRLENGYYIPENLCGKKRYGIGSATCDIFGPLNDLERVTATMDEHGVVRTHNYDQTNKRFEVTGTWQNRKDFRENCENLPYLCIAPVSSALGHPERRRGTGEEHMLHVVQQAFRPFFFWMLDTANEGSKGELKVWMDQSGHKPVRLFASRTKDNGSLQNYLDSKFVCGIMYMPPGDPGPVKEFYPLDLIQRGFYVCVFKPQCLGMSIFSQIPIYVDEGFVDVCFPRLKYWALMNPAHMINTVAEQPVPDDLIFENFQPRPRSCPTDWFRRNFTTAGERGKPDHYTQNNKFCTSWQTIIYNPGGHMDVLGQFTVYPREVFYLPDSWLSKYAKGDYMRQFFKYAKVQCELICVCCAVFYHLLLPLTAGG